jgi:hypothetical protein
MSYQEKKQPTDPGFTGGKAKEQDAKNLTSAQVLAANEKAVKGLQKSIDSSPHPYSISAAHDEAELKMRAQMRKKR